MGLFSRWLPPWWLGKIIAKKCGHEVQRKTEIEVFGEKFPMELKDGCTPDWCPACMSKAAIRCAWCGKFIMPGDPITLYSPTKNDFVKPEHAVVYQENPLQLVGCMRWECAHTGADRAGFWKMPGEVQRLLSPIEQVLMGGKDMVFVEDVGDRQEAVDAHNKALAGKRPG